MGTVRCPSDNAVCAFTPACGQLGAEWTVACNKPPVALPEPVPVICPQMGEWCAATPQCGTPGAYFSSRCDAPDPVTSPAPDPVTSPAPDPVKAPSHYTTGGVQPIDFIKSTLATDGFVDYCRGNVVKYVSRAPHKGGAQDYAKAAFYAQAAAHALEPEAYDDPRT